VFLWDRRFRLSIEGVGRAPRSFPAGVQLVDVALQLASAWAAPDLHGGGQFALLDGKNRASSTRYLRTCSNGASCLFTRAPRLCESRQAPGAPSANSATGGPFHGSILSTLRGGGIDGDERG